RPSTMPSPPSTRASHAGGRRSFAFAREDAGGERFCAARGLSPPGWDRARNRPLSLGRLQETHPCGNHQKRRKHSCTSTYPFTHRGGAFGKLTAEAAPSGRRGAGSRIIITKNSNLMKATMPRTAVPNPEQVPADSKSTLDAFTKNIGFTPNMLAT